MSIDPECDSDIEMEIDVNEHNNEEKLWTLYHLGLFKEDGITLVYDKRNSPLTYKGITVNICQRLRKHNLITAHGAKNCKRRGGHLLQEGKVIWKPFYIIRNIPARFARQLEGAVKPEYAKFRTAVLNEQKSNIRKLLKQSKDAFGRELLTSVKGTYEALQMTRCTPKACLTESIPMVIEWCMPEFRPTNSSELLLPSIQEKSLTKEEKVAIFSVSEKSHQWNDLKPWD